MIFSIVHRQILRCLPFCFLISILLLTSLVHGQQVNISNGQLYLDGEDAPFIYGAEVQYFRLRGGAGKNIPRQTVIDLWNKVLDRVVESGMNAVSFCIPWDFHEYAEGQFDFNGTADEDNDGNPDYPSRDIITFIKLVENHGIKTILIRPGPYINADWGFLGFGAVPLWFHEKYPDAHMRSPTGFKTKLFDYFNEPFLKATQSWFQALYLEVLKDKIGKGKPIRFVQLDNETNYMWQSIYNHDYSTKSVKRFQGYLRDKYSNLNGLNRSHNTNYGTWDEIRAPMVPGLNHGQDKDWYEFQDWNVAVYLGKLRRIWEDIGVKEPQIMFTNAESNSAAENGLMPNYVTHNFVGKTGLMTINLFPKKNDPGMGMSPLLNLPFEADIDTKLANVGSQAYLGNKNKWVMGSAVQGGWWTGVQVSSQARKQTYLTSIGHGMKAMFVYYFNEGWNWQWDWTKKEIQKIQRDLNYTETLNDEQWTQIQLEFSKKQFLGVDVKREFLETDKELSQIYFDAPVDQWGRPREHFQVLKDIGLNLVSQYSAELAKAKVVEDDVAILKETTSQSPSLQPEINPILLNSEWVGGLLAGLLQTKINPRIIMRDVDYTPLMTSKIIFSHDNGNCDNNTAVNVKAFLGKGGTWVNFLGTSLIRELGVKIVQTQITPETKILSLNYANVVSPPFDVPVLKAPVYSYQLPSECTPKLTWKTKVVAFACQLHGGTFIQVGVLMHEDFNSDLYNSSSLTNSQRGRLLWFENILRDVQVVPKVRWGSDFHRISLFTRTWDEKNNLGNNSTPAYFITVKSGEVGLATVKMIIPTPVLPVHAMEGGQLDGYDVTEIMAGKTTRYTINDVTQTGLVLKLPPQGIEVLAVRPFFK